MRDLDVPAPFVECEQGVKGETRLRVHLDLGIKEDHATLRDEIEAVIDYDIVIALVKEAACSKNSGTIEEFASDVVQRCLADSRVLSVELEVEVAAAAPNSQSPRSFVLIGEKVQEGDRVVSRITFPPTA